MGLRQLLEGFADIFVNGNRAGQEIGGTLLLQAGTEKFFGVAFECFQRDIHRLEERVASAKNRAECSEAEMTIKFGLARRARNDGEVVAAIEAVLPKQA